MKLAGLEVTEIKSVEQDAKGNTTIKVTAAPSAQAITGDVEIVSSAYGTTTKSNGFSYIDIEITDIAAITGVLKYDQQLTAGALTPADATATYQWQRADAEGGTFADIEGATSNTYTLVAADIGKWIRGQASGTGDYAGTVTSAARGPVEKADGPVAPSAPTLASKADTSITLNDIFGAEYYRGEGS